MSTVYIVVKACSFDDNVEDWAPTGIFKTMKAANAYIDREISAYRNGEIKVNGDEFVANSVSRSESGAIISGETADWYCNIIMSVHSLNFKD